jgi:tRNA (mo5U34)-methyltransferase
MDTPDHDRLERPSPSVRGGGDVIAPPGSGPEAAQPATSAEGRSSPQSRVEALRREMLTYEWYHTIDLGNGLVTPGEYDHAPLLGHYGIPDDLRGSTVLDIGPAHGFFAFEFEKRGAARVATAELPSWTDHDAGPLLKAQWQAEDASARYHVDTLGFAMAARQSKVERLYCNIYDLGPATTGRFDLVFCGSVLLHLTDPFRAMCAIRAATSRLAIVATGIDSADSSEARALFYGTADGQAFWMPNMACLERWALAAGFARVERVSTFVLASRGGRFQTPHGVIRAFVE